jgi:cytochrome d ubiquinol oxidase subunit II
MESLISDSLLPDIFAVLMALAILMYAILDGYDLGVGMLLPMDKQENNQKGHRDTMIASIGPFWDANETWLVLAVGILLIAFPTAHSLILGELYLPIFVMLLGLILRGVAFDFRAKVRQGRKEQWDMVFKVGSFLASGSQGYMLGLYIMGFESSPGAYVFAVLSAVGVIAAYTLIGAAWLILRTENALQQQSLLWAKKALLMSFVGIVAVCLVNPLVNPAILEKWTSGTGLVMLFIIPTTSMAFLGLLFKTLNSETVLDSKKCVWPFVYVIVIFVSCFAGLGYSFYPYVVPGQMTIQSTASAPESLRFILIGAVVVMPCILAYTVFSYRIFRGKVRELSYY